MTGISNVNINKIINEIDGDLKQNFVGVFPSDQTFRFFKYKHLIKEKKAPYPFMVMNTDRKNEEGEHWWSLLEISEKKQIFLFDSFGFVGLKDFIIADDRQILDQFFYGLEKINKNDKKINLIYVRFEISLFKKANKNALTSTAKDFFHSLNEFGKIHNTDYVDIYMVDDQLQNIKTDTCGLFQLYFYINLFLPKEKSQIIKNKTLNLQTIRKLLNEIFTRDTIQNEEIVENFALEHGIKKE